MIAKKTRTAAFALPLFLLLTLHTTAQVTVAFQGGEPGDTWTYTSTGAGAAATAEAGMPSNRITGTKSVVAGGNTGGGSCFPPGGTGNGPSVARTFTFDVVDISGSSDFTRTLNFHWGNRYPVCNGTGWDAGENLMFRPWYGLNGAPATPQGGWTTLATGNNNAAYNIQTNQHSYTIPPCATSFKFEIYVTTNRADELLFLEDVRITSPQLNGSASQPSPVTGPVTICPGAPATYSVTAVPGTTYTWSGLPAGAQFTSSNGTTAGTIDVDWGTAAPGTYTLIVTPAGSCSGTPGPAQTIDVTVEAPPAPLTISGPTTFCAGTIATLTSNYATGNSWSTSETSQQIGVFLEGTYTVNVTTACGILNASHTITANYGPEIQSIQENDVSCFGQTDGSLVITAIGSNLQYSLDNTNWQPSPTFSNLAPGTYTVYVSGTVNSCVSQETAEIEASSQLTATATNDGPFCEGATITLHGTSSAPNATFAWTGPNGYTSSVQDPADATEAGVYTLTVSVSSCTSDPVSTTVAIIDVPQAIAGNTGPYCVGDPVQLTGASDLATAADYAWTGPNGYTSAAQNPIDATLAGTYTLTVTNNGCSGTPASTTVVINPIPDAAADYTAPFCPGTPLLLNGTTSATGATFAWTGPASYASAAEDPNDAAQAGTYTLVVTANGCTSAPASVTVVVQLPTVTVSNNSPACEGTPVQLSSSTSAAAPTYSWTGPNSYSSADANPTGVLGPGVYTLTITSNNCTSDPVSTTVSVTDVPQALAANTGPYCTGDPVQLSGNTDLVTAVDYSWTGPNNYTSSAQSPTDATLAGTYTLTVTNDGCSGAPASTTVVINTIPDAAASYTAPFCPGNPLLLEGTTSATGATFAWNGPAAYTSAVEDPNDAAQAGTYTLIVTANGCASTPASVTVVAQSPTVTVSNTGPACEGTPVQLGSSTSAAAPTYSWSGPNGYTSAAANPTGITESGVYTLTMTSGNCTATASTAVVIFENPVAAFPVAPVCALDEHLFQSQSTVANPQNITDWDWDFDDASNGSGQAIAHAFGTSGTFDVTLQVTTDAGCTDAITQTVVVNEPPKASFYYSPGTISAYEPTVEFINSSSFADAYAWTIAGDGGITEESPVYTFPQTAGNYTVELIAYNAAGCSDTVRKIITSENTVVYYVPNAFTPDGDEFNNEFRPVFTEGFDPANFELMIFNRWGEMIFQSYDPQSGWDGTYRDELQADGVYVWNIRFKYRENDAYEEVSGHVTMLH